MKRLIKKIDMDSHYLLGLFWNILVDIHHSILSPSILFNNQRQIIDFCSVLALSLPENGSSIIELRIKHSKLVFPGWSWFNVFWFGWWPGWSCTAERWSAPSTSADCAGVRPPQLWGWNLPMAWDSFLHIWQLVSSGFPVHNALLAKQVYLWAVWDWTYDNMSHCTGQSPWPLN